VNISYFLQRSFCNRHWIDFLNIKLELRDVREDTITPPDIFNVYWESVKDSANVKFATATSVRSAFKTFWQSLAEDAKLVSFFIYNVVAFSELIIPLISLLKRWQNVRSKPLR